MAGRIKSRPGELPIATEDQEQKALVQWLDAKRLLFYHIPNGGCRSGREASKFKLLGVKSGVPDLCIPIARGGFHALYIELKRKYGGKVSDSQMAWLDALRREGNLAEIAFGCDHAIEIITSYCNIK